MDTQRLQTILMDCSAGSILKGQEEPDELPYDTELVDCHFFKMMVINGKAEEHRDEIVSLLEQWPTEAWGQEVPQLQQGPNYIHSGAAIGDQGTALMLYCVGEVLGFWEVVTPATVGFEGKKADELAGRGLVMITGYNPVAA